MKEILFRGKRIDNGKWVEGYYSKLDADEFGDEPHMILSKTLRRFYVDPATVGQYTGLTDKNGTRIFEGDVVNAEWQDKKAALVTFQDGMFKAHGMSLVTWAHPDYFLEVIGNIHDNPELMEVRNG